MKLLGKMSDKMLSAFAPKTEAGACVPGSGTRVWTSSGCACSSDKHYYHKQCTVSCNGPLINCTPCQRTGSIC